MILDGDMYVRLHTYLWILQVTMRDTTQSNSSHWPLPIKQLISLTEVEWLPRGSWFGEVALMMKKGKGTSKYPIVSYVHWMPELREFSICMYLLVQYGRSLDMAWLSCLSRFPQSTRTNLSKPTHLKTQPRWSHDLLHQLVEYIRELQGHSFDSQRRAFEKRESLQSWITIGQKRGGRLVIANIWYVIPSTLGSVLTQYHISAPKKCLCPWVGKSQSSRQLQPGLLVSEITKRWWIKRWSDLLSDLRYFWLQLGLYGNSPISCFVVRSAPCCHQRDLKEISAKTSW